MFPFPYTTHKISQSNRAHPRVATPFPSHEHSCCFLPPFRLTRLSGPFPRFSFPVPRVGPDGNKKQAVWVVLPPSPPPPASLRTPTVGQETKVLEVDPTVSHHEATGSPKGSRTRQRGSRHPKLKKKIKKLKNIKGWRNCSTTGNKMYTSSTSRVPRDHSRFGRDQKPW